MSTAKFKNFSAAILSGGKNRRMAGENKAFIKIAGKPIIERIIRVLETMFEEIIIVTNRPAEYLAYQKKCRIITDIFKNIGPLGGIHAALAYAKTRNVFFIACDMPFLHNEIIIEQLKLFGTINCDAFLPIINGYSEPLHAIYNTKIASSLEKFVKTNNDYRIINFLETIKTYYWEVSPGKFSKQSFYNINTPKDLQQISWR